MKVLICLAAALAACAPAAQNSADQAPETATGDNVQKASLKGQPDVVAVYRMNGPDGTQVATMTVEANDSGAARLEMRLLNGAAPPQVGWATVDGDVIMTVNTPEGPKLVRASDMAAASEEMLTRMAPPGANMPNPFDDLRLVEVGPETVGGRSGTRYVIRVEGEEADDRDPQMDFVIANDPALALIGRATSHTLAPGTSTTGGFDASAMRELRQRMRAGIALRTGAVLVLESVEHKAVDPARLVVQGTPISRDELRAIMQRAMPSSPPPPPIIRAPRRQPETPPSSNQQ